MISIDRKSLEQECTMVVSSFGVDVKIGGGKIVINGKEVTEKENKCPRCNRGSIKYETVWLREPMLVYYCSKKCGWEIKEFADDPTKEPFEIRRSLDVKLEKELDNELR